MIESEREKARRRRRALFFFVTSATPKRMRRAETREFFLRLWSFLPLRSDFSSHFHDDESTPARPQEHLELLVLHLGKQQLARRPPPAPAAEAEAAPARGLGVLL